MDNKIDGSTIDKIIKLEIEKIIQAEADKMPGGLIGYEGRKIYREYFYEIIFGTKNP